MEIEFCWGDSLRSAVQKARTFGTIGKRAQALTRIFDNIKQDLGSHLEKTLDVSNTMDVAVGYFNLRGWAVFDQLVRDKAESWNEGDPPIVRILIGMVTAGVQQETLDALQADLEGTGESDADANAARERKAILIEQLRLQLMRGLPTAADRAVLQSLRDLLSIGAVEINRPSASRKKASISRSPPTTTTASPCTSTWRGTRRAAPALNGDLQRYRQTTDSDVSSDSDDSDDTMASVN